MHTRYWGFKNESAPDGAPIITILVHAQSLQASTCSAYFLHLIIFPYINLARPALYSMCMCCTNRAASCLVNASAVHHLQVPLLDMANHAEGWQAVVTKDNSTGSVLMIAVEPIRAGQEVRVTSSIKSHSVQVM